MKIQTEKAMKPCSCPGIGFKTRMDSFFGIYDVFIDFYYWNLYVEEYGINGVDD